MVTELISLLPFLEINEDHPNESKQAPGLEAAGLEICGWANQNWDILSDSLGIHIPLSPVVPKLEIEAKSR